MSSVTDTVSNLPGTIREQLDPKREEDIVRQTALLRQSFSGVTMFLAGVTLGTVFSKLLGKKKPSSASSTPHLE